MKFTFLLFLSLFVPGGCLSVPAAVPVLDLKGDRAIGMPLGLLPVRLVVAVFRAESNQAVRVPFGNGIVAATRMTLDSLLLDAVRKPGGDPQAGIRRRVVAGHLARWRVCAAPIWGDLTLRFSLQLHDPFVVPEHACRCACQVNPRIDHQGRISKILRYQGCHMDPRTPTGLRFPLICHMLGILMDQIGSQRHLPNLPVCQFVVIVPQDVGFALLIAPHRRRQLAPRLVRQPRQIQCNQTRSLLLQCRESPPFVFSLQLRIVDDQQRRSIVEPPLQFKRMGCAQVLLHHFSPAGVNYLLQQMFHPAQIIIGVGLSRGSCLSPDGRTQGVDESIEQLELSRVGRRIKC